MITILFLCTGNSCRSQMAEGWARHLKSNEIKAYSAGIESHGLNPHAVAVMREAGVDISSQQSKTLHMLGNITLDYVVTLCGHAHETCPVFPGKVRLIHVGFDDPAVYEKTASDQEAILKQFRRVRDEIRSYIETLPESLAHYD